MPAPNGHTYPTAYTQTGYGTGADGKFIFDYQLVRGVNHMNIRGLTSAGGINGSGTSARSFSGEVR